LNDKGQLEIYFYEGKRERPIRLVKWENNGGNKPWVCDKLDNDIELVMPTNPQIGMTSEEVKESLWGIPLEINKTTTKYSVSEQWVYDNYRYVYLENGIVTAIQE
jgi:hypothetical protein